MYKFTNVIIKKIPVGDLLTNCYIIENKETNTATLIDPGSDCDRILQNIDVDKIESVILTHGHFDHIGAIDDISIKYDFTLYIHEEDAEMLNDPDKNLSSGFMSKPLIIKHDYKTYKDGDTITSSNINFTIMHTPGHTKGSSCLLINIDDQNLIFTGDTLFAGGHGRTDFYGGSFSDMVNSIRKLFKLKGTYLCFPGHGDNTQLGKE